MVLRTPFYRAAFMSLFISGVGVSAAGPQLALFFVKELGASLSVAGLFYLTNVSAPVVGFFIGRLSDRRSDRLSLFRFCALVGGVGWIAMAFSTEIWMPFVISLVLLGPAGAAGGLLFAAARDELTRHPSGADNRVVATLRMGFSAGWIVGPVIGFWFGSVYGLRALLLGSAVCALMQIVPLLRTQVPREVVSAPPINSPVPRSYRELLPLFTFVSLCVLAASGDTVKFAYLPLYMEDHLHIPAGLRGAVIAAQPVLELILIPIFGWAADRLGAPRLMILGSLLGVVGNLGYVFSTTVVGLFAAQAAMAGLLAAIAGLGVTVAQNLYPQGVGVASTTFFSAIMFSGAVGGVAASIGVTTLGLPGVFLLPAGLCALAAIGLTVQELRRRRTCSSGLSVRDQVREPVALQMTRSELQHEAGVALMKVSAVTESRST
jgi:SET family sugar efflux transporter-like MFS transporter